MDGKTEKGRGLTRRDFLEGTGAALVVAGAAPKFAGAESSEEAANLQAAGTAPRTRIRLTVNGTEHRIEVEDRWRRPGEKRRRYVGTELVAGSTDVIFIRASRASGEITQTAEIAFGLGLRYEGFELALARSFASSIVEGSEPVYVSFGLRF